LIHHHGKKLFHQGVFLKAKWYKIRVGKASDLPHDHQSSGRLSEFRKWRLPNDADRISLFFTTIRMNGINDDLYVGRFLKSFMTRKIKKCLEFF
jgi:hypothetical protein